MKACDYIFIRVPVANQAMFFGGKSPALKKDDLRIRVIPFPTRRPTFSEAKRVHRMLASVECYGKFVLLICALILAYVLISSSYYYYLAFAPPHPPSSSRVQHS